MSASTNIEWCDSTFNPWIGCTRVSPACDDCYAARSTPARTLGVAWGPKEERRRTSAANWKQPLRWNAKRFMRCNGCGWRGELAAELIGCGACGSTDHLQDARRRIFCASLADVFDNAVPVQWRRDLFDLIEATPNLDWLLLTKRIGNASRLYAEAYLDSARAWPRNVWLGATICNQEEADRDIPKLLATPAAVRFLSIEPMLGPITRPVFCACGCRLLWERAVSDAMRGGSAMNRDQAEASVKAALGVDWVICGGESGPNARPMHPDWARSLRDQCAVSGVPFLFKQWGEWAPYDRGISDGATLPTRNALDEPMGRPGKKAAGRLLDGRTHDAFPQGCAA